MAEKKIGEVFTFFSQVSVAGIKITDGELTVGDTIHIKGATTDVTQSVDSMQVDRNPIEKAARGDSIGIKVKDKVRPTDIVYKVISED